MAMASQLNLPAGFPAPSTLHAAAYAYGFPAWLPSRISHAREAPMASQLSLPMAHFPHPRWHAGWPAGCVVGWQACLLAAWLPACLAGLTRWLAGWLACWLAGELIGKLGRWLACSPEPKLGLGLRRPRLGQDQA